MYRSPRLEIPGSRALPPLDRGLGTSPSQAADSRPFLKQLRSPTAATSAVAVTGPMPSISPMRRHISSVRKQVSEPPVAGRDASVELREFLARIADEFQDQIAPTNIFAIHDLREGAPEA
jgi:hypothetical protein